MHLLPQIVFLLLFVGASWFFARNIVRIRRNILLGRPEDRSDHPGQRWGTMARVALGQGKMGARPVAAVMHLFIYVGFVLINVEVLEIILDGLFGTHRIGAGLLGGLYGGLIGFFEVLAFLVLLSCVVFLARRLVTKVPRLTRGPEMKRWPRQDAVTILVIEIVLMVAILTMNAADTLLQERGVDHYIDAVNGNPQRYLVSQALIPMLDGLGSNALVAVERVCWWFHIIGILAFMNYLPFSKHLHIGMAFPNTWYSDLQPMGQLANNPTVAREVQAMMGDPYGTGATPPEPGAQDGHTEPALPERFGAKDIHDLSWKSLMDAYSCTECGRCTSACPANITGKLLSPRKIMMDTRDRMEEVGRALDIRKGTTAADVSIASGEPAQKEKTLLHDYITTEELWACTTCNACVQACPININPLRIIMDLRTYLALEETNVPTLWAGMLGNIENNGAPWKFSAMDRDNWTQDVVVKQAAEAKAE